MSTAITRIEKSTPDKRLRLDIPVDAAGRNYVVEIKEVPEAPAKGWPPGFLERTYGSITDPTFVRPSQDEANDQLNSWPTGFLESICGKWVGNFERDPGKFTRLE